MSFNILDVRDGDEGEDALYPAVGLESDTVELREDDGQPSAPLIASELIIREIPPGGNPKRLLRLQDVKAAVRTTQASLSLAPSTTRAADGRGLLGRPVRYLELRARAGATASGS